MTEEEKFIEPLDGDDVGEISDTENETDNEIDETLLSDEDSDIDVLNEGAEKASGSESLSNVEYYDSDEDEEEEFDKLNNSDIAIDLLNEHPEYISHNIKEVHALCNVIRNSNGIIIDELHRTIPFVTRYEKAKILGERSKQLSYSNVEPMIKVPPDVIDSYEIAKLEYNANMIPFIIKRNMPDGSCEYWRFKDLEKIIFD